MLDELGRSIGGEQKSLRALDQARALVTAEPQAWQRGKDRASFVLSALRSGLRPEIAAVSTVMMIFTLITLSLAALILRRAGDSATDIARTMSGT